MKCQSKFKGCAAAWPDDLIEVSHHNQAPYRSPTEYVRKTGKILFVISPLHLTIQSSPRLSPRTEPGNTDSDDGDVPQGSLSDSSDESSRRHRVDPQVIYLVPRFFRPEHYLPPTVLDPVAVVGLRADNVPALRQPTDMGLSEAGYLGHMSIYAAYNFRVRRELGVAHSTFQLTNLSVIPFSLPLLREPVSQPGDRRNAIYGIRNKLEVDWTQRLVLWTASSATSWGVQGTLGLSSDRGSR